MNHYPYARAVQSSPDRERFSNERLKEFWVPAHEALLLSAALVHSRLWRASQGEHYILLGAFIIQRLVPWFSSR